MPFVSKLLAPYLERDQQGHHPARDNFYFHLVAVIRLACRNAIAKQVVQRPFLQRAAQPQFDKLVFEMLPTKSGGCDWADLHECRF